MIKIQKIKNDIIILTSDSGIIHKIGTDAYYPSFIMLPSETINMYEEVDEKPAYTQQQYNAKVEELIAEKYSHNQETSLINNFLETNPSQTHIDEYYEYQSFRLECKQKAKNPNLYK